MSNQNNKVVVTTKNTTSLTLGIISLVIGVLAILVGWIPFLSLLAIPSAIIGLSLAGIGVLIALFNGFNGFLMPFLGGFICVISIFLPIMFTDDTSTLITKTPDEVSQSTEKASEDLVPERKRQELQEKQKKDI
ncbi:MAG: hypothetical protein AVO38_01810 [delta proteobacterium ML8_D]|nr:MAG: hypothetical protein AVO38_01810 [delta proteobacterium ML8_D]